jgi:hypothetical protein
MLISSCAKMLISIKESAMARVFVLKETTLDESPGPKQWTFWFQWCRYQYDRGEEPQYGYRFIWRRPDDDGGGLQPARGQARIPSVAVIEQLIAKARKAGWGFYNGDDSTYGFATLWASVDDVLDPKFEAEQRQTNVRAFIRDANFGHLSLYDFEGMIGRIPIGGAFGRGDIFKNPRELYKDLSDEERDQLKAHFLQRAEGVEREFPELVREFPEQFRR